MGEENLIGINSSSSVAWFMLFSNCLIYICCNQLLGVLMVWKLIGIIGFTVNH